MTFSPIFNNKKQYGDIEKLLSIVLATAAAAVWSGLLLSKEKGQVLD
jgi:hypothetical protein